MPLKDLTPSEQAIILECLKAAVDGPFFSDHVYHTIFGLERHEVQAVIDSWPVNDADDSHAKRAINNALNNLTGYPHRRDDVWDQYVPIPREELLPLFYKWRGEEYPPKHKPRPKPKYTKDEQIGRFKKWREEQRKQKSDLS